MVLIHSLGIYLVQKLLFARMHPMHPTWPGSCWQILLPPGTSDVAPTGALLRYRSQCCSPTLHGCGRGILNRQHYKNVSTVTGKGFHDTAAVSFDWLWMLSRYSFPLVFEPRPARPWPRTCKVGG